MGGVITVGNVMPTGRLRTVLTMAASMLTSSLKESTSARTKSNTRFSGCRVKYEGINFTGDEPVFERTMTSHNVRVQCQIPACTKKIE